VGEGKDLHVAAVAALRTGGPLNYESLVLRIVAARLI
jgi:hypothetical protein